MVTIILSSAAALVQMFSQLKYIHNLIKNKIVLNSTTWFVVVLVQLLSTSAFYLMVSKSNPVIATSTIIAAVGVIFTFIFALVKGKFAKMEIADKVSLVLALITTAVWFVSKSAEYASLLIQATYVIAFTPTIIGLLRGTLREKAFPWFLSSAAGGCIVAAVIASSGFSNIMSILHPLVIGVFLNGVIGVIAILQDKNLIKKPY